MVQFAARFPRLRSFAAFSACAVLPAIFLALHPSALSAQVQFVPSIQTVAGDNAKGVGYSGDNGPATLAQLYYPGGVAEDQAGNLYIADHNNSVVRKVDVNGIITTFAGGGTGACATATDPLGDGCPATDAVFVDPEDVAVDAAGNIYISVGGGGLGGSLIHKVDRATGIISDYAGNFNMYPGYSGDNGPATSAQLSGPTGIALDTAGNLYIADYGNNVIRKVTLAGIITTVAGGGTGVCGGTPTDPMEDGCIATYATLSGPQGVAVDVLGNLYIADTNDDVVRKVTQSTGIITNFAGTPQTAGYGGDGGPAIGASLNTPTSVVADAVGNIYIADSQNYVVRKVNIGGIITTVAGTAGGANYTGDNGVATSAEIDVAQAVALGGAGDLYIADIYNDVIRKVDLSGITAFLPIAVGQASASQNIFFQLASGVTPPIAVEPGFRDFTAGSPACGADTAGNLCSVAVTFGPQVPGARSAPIQVTAGGSYFFPTTGTGNGPSVALTPGVISTYAKGAQPIAVATDDGGNLYVADQVQNAVTKVSTTGAQTQVATGLNEPFGVAVDAAGNLYVANTRANNVVKFPADGGAQTTIGSGLTGPQGVAVDAVGNVYIANTGAESVVEVPANGAAQINLATGLSNPTGIAVDGLGNVYVVERGGGDVTEIPISGGARVSIATGLDLPGAIAVDAAGNIYISVNGGPQIVEKVDAATHAISTVAGSNASGYTGDGGAATSATLNQPWGVATDGTGNLYIADSGNAAVRKVVVSPSSATVTFVATNVGLTSSDSPQSVSLTNIGNEPLTIQSLAIMPSADSASFALDSSGVPNACSTSLVAVGSSCGVGVSFDPTLAGNLTGTAAITDNALNVTGTAQTIPLNGTGTYAAATLAFLPIPPASLPVGSSIGTVKIDVDTTTGSVDTTSNASVTLTLTGPSGFTAENFTATAVNGVATFSLTTPLNTLGAYQLTASSSGLTSATATVTVTTITPVLMWTPATLQEVYGTALGTGVLDATVSGGVQGSFTYTAQPTGEVVNAATVLTPGTYVLTATFTPANTVNYTTASKTVTFTVTNGTLVVTANNATRVYGTANPQFTGTVQGAVHGDTFVETFATTAQQNTDAGTYAIVPSVAGPDLADYTVIVNDGTLTITKAATSMTLQASGTAVAVGSTVTLTATVASSTTGVPTGTVTFYDGANPLGTSALNAQGVATFNMTSLPAGTNTISAVYGGDVNFIGTSGQLAQPIVAGIPSYALTASPSSLTTKQGQSVGTMVTITPQYGFNGTVALSCMNLPAGAACQFSNSNIALNGNNQGQNSQLTITTWGVLPSNTAANHLPVRRDKPMGMLMASIFWLPGLLLGGFLAAERKRLRGSLRHVMMVLVAVTGLLGMMGGMTGCANLTPDAAIGNYQIRVVGTPSNGASAQSVSLNLVIMK